MSHLSIASKSGLLNRRAQSTLGPRHRAVGLRRSVIPEAGDGIVPAHWRTGADRERRHHSRGPRDRNDRRSRVAWIIDAIVQYQREANSPP